MRLIFIGLFFFITHFASAQLVTNSNYNFGKVTNWNNPMYETTYTNLSSRIQLFLPIRYDRDIRITYGKSSLAPGESTSIKVQYFTEELGKFRKSIRIFVSTQDNPIVLTMKGNIKSMHPEAYTTCPRIENYGTKTTIGFVHTIKVVDETTGEILTDYDLDIVTPTSKESMEVGNSKLELKRKRPQFYFFTVDKEGYEITKKELYVQRNTKETTFYLKQETIEEDPEIFDFSDTTASDQDIEDEILTTDTLAKAIEKSVEEIDTADFVEGGTLNERKYAFNHIVFLIDISSSMKKPDKLPLLKHSMDQMINVLRPQDKVSIITYSTNTVVVADQISGGNKQTLKKLVEGLEAQGNSYGKEAVDIAYEQAKKYLIADGNNEIILASDGVFNSKNFKEKKMYRSASMQYAFSDIRLSTIGFGNTSRALKFLETLANRGQGSYIEIRTKEEANTTLIQNLMKHSVRE